LTPGARAAQSILTISTSSGALAPPASGPARFFVPLREWRPTVVMPMLVWSGLMAMLWFGVRRTNWRRTAALAAASATAALLAIGAAVPGSAALHAEAAMDAGIALFPSSLNLGSQTVGTTSVARVISLTNIGADPLLIGAITIVGDFAQVNNCGSSLAPGAHCSISVTMTPTLAAAITGTLTIADNAAGSPHTVGLLGTGLAAPTAGGATPAGSYTVTVAGTVGTLSHATGVTIGVQ
jgi:hypothetical protein